MADIVLIGAGIMSATLGTFLQELMPEVRILLFERSDHAAAESSDSWNNAGTGHAAYCELNYTPQREDGRIDISKALQVSESFEQSKQFWSQLVEEGVISPNFIRPVPHCSFVWGEENVAFLRARHAAMSAVPFFAEMQYSEDPAQIAQWMPLVMEGRSPLEKVAATYMPLGTDVDFGALTRALLNRMEERGALIHYNQEVRDIHRIGEENIPDQNVHWKIRVKDLATDAIRVVETPFVFIGAGGGALPLLQKADIPEGKHFGGFPVSGQWLRCNNRSVIEAHQTKVYGKAGVGAPPMSVPHLDTRRINGEPALLFGPYAGFSTRFLKSGSLWDLPKSIRLSNLVPMLSAGWHNIPLTKYLITQVMQSDKDRMAALREYYPLARPEDWEVEVAGQRVQIIKADEADGGVLEFGTELIASADGSIAALLGASPGASTSVSIMIGLLERCFPLLMASEAGKAKMRELVPSYGIPLAQNPELLHQVRKEAAFRLQITE
jgi:malate dehydrogenase (quinone)